MFDLGGLYFEDGTKRFLEILSNKTRKTFEELYPIFREGKSLEYRKNKLSGDKFFAWASKQVNGKLSASELNQLWVSQYKEVPEVKQLVLDLRNAGKIVTVLSDNVPERVDYLQEKYHFKEHFDDMVLSYEVNLVKQSPEIFNLALERIKAQPEEAVFIDDRKDNLEVANAVGIEGILYQNSQQLRKDISQFVDLD